MYMRGYVDVPPMPKKSLIHTSRKRDEFHSLKSIIEFSLLLP